MSVLVRIIGIVITIMGVVFLLNPPMLKKALGYFKQGKRLYGAGVARIVLGVIFLLSASQCRLAWVIVVLGLLFLVAGIFIFGLGLDKCRGIVDKVEGKPDFVIRLITVIPIIIGLLIICSV